MISSTSPLIDFYPVGERDGAMMQWWDGGMVRWCVAYVWRIMCGFISHSALCVAYDVVHGVVPTPFNQHLETFRRGLPSMV
jgi:hypothetical protein